MDEREKVNPDSPQYDLVNFMMNLLDPMLSISKMGPVDALAIELRTGQMALIPLSPPDGPMVDTSPRVSKALDCLGGSKEIKRLCYVFLTLRHDHFKVRADEPLDLKAIQERVDALVDEVVKEPLGKTAAEIENLHTVVVAGVERGLPTLMLSHPYRVVPQIDGEDKVELSGEPELCEPTAFRENPAVDALMRFMGL